MLAFLLFVQIPGLYKIRHIGKATVNTGAVGGAVVSALALLAPAA